MNSPKKLHLAMLICLILLFWGLSLDSLVKDSPTMDEQNHIARGLAWWKMRDPRLSVEHPPLINIISTSLTLALPNIDIPYDHPSWSRNSPFFWYEFADVLFWERNVAYVSKIVFLARIPIVFMTIFMALLGYVYASQLWHNKRAGIFATLLILSDPNILAHGRYSTTDIGGTLAVLFTFYILFRSAAFTNRKRYILLILAVGIGLSSKLTFIAFLPIIALLDILYHHEYRNATRLFSYLTKFVLVCLGSLFFVWCIYLFEWNNFLFLSDALKPLNQFRGPMPTFWAGIERIMAATGNGRDAFLLGHFSSNGFFFYFPVAFLLKTPLTNLLLFITAIPILIRNKMSRQKTFLHMLPIFLFFVIVMTTGLNIGYRHILPILPILYVCCSGLVSQLSILQSPKWIYLFVMLGMIFGGSAFSTHPHYISYFNILVDQDHKWQYLGDSNIDWGQDLYRLNDWMEENGVESIKLSYFGSAQPRYFLAFDYSPLPGDKIHRELWWDVPFNRESPEEGVYAISVHNLLELPLQTDKTVFSWFREHEPDTQVGSINIYFIPGQK